MNLSYVNKSFCKLLCSVFVAVNNFERFWVRQFFRCRCWARLVWAQLDTQRFCRQFAVHEGIKQMVKMITCAQCIKPKVWMIGAYGSSRAGEIAAGVNLFVLNPSSTKSLTWLSRKEKISIKQRNIQKKRTQKWTCTRPFLEGWQVPAWLLQAEGDVYHLLLSLPSGAWLMVRVSPLPGEQLPFHHEHPCHELCSSNPVCETREDAGGTLTFSYRKRKRKAPLRLTEDCSIALAQNVISASWQEGPLHQMVASFFGSSRIHCKSCVE